MTQNHVSESQQERHSDSCQGDIQRSDAHADQIFGIGFQADGKQQEDCSDFSNCVNRIVQVYKICAIRAYHDPSENLAQHRGQPQALKDFAKQFGPDKNEEKLKEEWVSIMHKRACIGARFKTLPCLRCRAPAKSRVAAGKIGRWKLAFGYWPNSRALASGADMLVYVFPDDPLNRGPDQLSSSRFFPQHLCVLSS